MTISRTKQTGRICDEKIFVLVLLFLCSFAQAQTLKIYGGADHDVYLGKLNASNFDSELIWNGYGTYGSEYSSYSPFNEYASNPPVLVDDDGNFYGYFTINAYKSKRANFDLVNKIYEYYDLIRDDVSKWYDKLF